MQWFVPWRKKLWKLRGRRGHGCSGSVEAMEASGLEK